MEQRAEIRFTDTRIKRSVALVRSRLGTYASGHDLQRFVVSELRNLKLDLTRALNPIKVKVHLQGGEQIILTAELTVDIKLTLGALAEVSVGKRKKPRPLKIDFGSGEHRYLCEARRASLVNNNIDISRLRVEGLITERNYLTEVGLHKLERLEKTLIAEVEVLVFRNLLYVADDKGPVVHMVEYLIGKDLIIQTPDVWKFTPTETGVAWLESNTARLIHLESKNSSLTQCAMQFLALEELNEYLVHEDRWIRQAAEKRATVLETRK